MVAVRKYRAAGAFKALPLAARQCVDAAIEAHLSAVEALTAVLDQQDPDPDLEDGADAEPWLGDGYNGGNDREGTWRETHGGGFNAGDNAHPEDAEPSMSIGEGVNQVRTMRD